MPKIQYKDINLKPESVAIVAIANKIIEEFQSDGYDLTLRQLYYQFVARDLIANKQKEYKRLGCIINDARLAGLVDWDAIVDRTRNLEKLSHWGAPSEIVSACADQYREDKWAEQSYRVEVWIEKDALVGVLERVCTQLEVPYFSCRGYTSQSEMWSAGQRMRGYERDGQTPIILHLGDHDPSGIDMTRDIQDRLTLFNDGPVEVLRIALNEDQVEKYNPPPNPAKITDSRARNYIQNYGTESWELDALNPKIISALIEKHVAKFRDDSVWNKSIKRETRGKTILTKITKELRKLNK